MSQPYIKTKTHRTQSSVAVIEFFHPAQNSLPSDLLRELARAIEAAGADAAVKVIVLQSGGDRTFCAGASLAELAEIKDATAGEQFFRGFADVINAMRVAPKFIIARVQGKVVGGGVGLAAAADYCLANRQAAIKLGELSLGLAPLVVAPPIVRKIGAGAMTELSMRPGDFFDAKWAADKGLYAQVVESLGDEVIAVDEAVDAFVAQLAGYDAHAMLEQKRACWAGTEHWDELLAERAATGGRLVLTDFTQAALRKFGGK